MPNWCSNTLQISGSKEKINHIEQSLIDFEGKDFFNIFVEPAAEDNPDWYSYNQENYGCKWNCSANDWDRQDDSSITIMFDSPWGPPIALYEFIEKLGLDVYAQYFEPGMCFVGQFSNGSDDYYEYNDLESLDQIDPELVDCWCLREMLEEQAKWDAEVDADDGPQLGVEISRD